MPLSTLPTIFAASKRIEKDYRRLSHMTDRQLAAKGLKRDEICQHLQQMHFGDPITRDAKPARQVVAPLGVREA